MIPVRTSALRASLRPIPVLLGLVMVVVAASLASRPSGAAPAVADTASNDASASIEAEVRAFLKHYTEVIEAEDADAIRSLYVPDDRFAWYTDGALVYASPNAVVAGRMSYRGVRFETTYSDMRIVALGSTLASVRTGFRTRLEIPGQADHEYGGVITWLVERDPEAGWRVLLGHTSTPGGPPTSNDER